MRVKTNFGKKVVNHLHRKKIIGISIGTRMNQMKWYLRILNGNIFTPSH